MPKIHWVEEQGDDEKRKEIEDELRAKLEEEISLRAAAEASQSTVMQDGKASKNKSTALVFCIFTAVGHRFYVGKLRSGILMALVYLTNIISIIILGMTSNQAVIDVLAVFFLFAALGYIIWWIIDLVMICNGEFKDKQGNPLKKN